MEDAILADAEFADVASTLEVAVGTGAAVMRELEPSPLYPPPTTVVPDPAVSVSGC